MGPRHSPVLLLFFALACAVAASTARGQGQLTKAPRIKLAPPPAYPAEALAAGLSADVTLPLDIGPDGRVMAAKVVKAAGNGFDAHRRRGRRADAHR